MAVISLLVSISVLIAHAQDFRSLTEADMKELGVQSAKSLQGCASTLALDDASNLTSEAVDKNVLLKNISEAYQAAHFNVDSKSNVVGKFKIKSSTSESKTNYQMTYTLEATLTKAGKVVCKGTSQLIKTSKAGL